MQSFNYHAHTKRCGHAIGEDEEYVIEAIRNGYQRIGVSDHMPYPNGYLETDRMHEDEFEGYVQSMRHLQQKYAKDIELRIGLEFEYYPDFEEYLWDMKKCVDYFILGQHDRGLFAQQKYAKDIELRIGLEFEYYPDFEEYLWDMKKCVDYFILGQHDRGLFALDFYKNYQDEDTELYGKLVVEAIEKGLPDILAHPDLFMYGKEEWTATCEKVAHDICKAAQDHQVILEVNLNGLKYGKCKRGKETRYLYPYRRFWEIASQYDVRVIYGHHQVILEVNLNGLKYGKCKRGKETRYLYPYRRFWEIASQYDVRVIYGLDAHAPQKYSDRTCYDIVNQEIIYDLPLTFVEDLSFDKKI